MEHEIDFEKRKMSKKKKILIWILISLIFLVVTLTVIKIYINNYNEHLEKAKYYFSIEDYQNAYSEAEQLFPQSFNKDFVEKLKIMDNTTQSLKMIPTLKSGEWTSLFDAIVFGIENVDFYKKQAKKYGIENKLAKIRQQYVDELMKIFAMTEADAKNMPEYTEEEKEKWLYEKGRDAINYSPNSITLEIADKNYRVEGDNVYVSGTVKNNSNMTCYYIEITVSFFNESGDIIDEDTQIISTDDALSPKSTKYFEVMSQRNSETKKFSIFVSDFDTQAK